MARLENRMRFMASFLLGSRGYEGESLDRFRPARQYPENARPERRRRRSGPVLVIQEGESSGQKQHPRPVVVAGRAQGDRPEQPGVGEQAEAVTDLVVRRAQVAALERGADHISAGL